jgi:hypothetical protein
MSTVDELESVDVENEVEEALAPATAEPSSAGRRRLPVWLRGDSPVLIYLGIALAVIGFVLILVAWGQVAGETQVYLQLPYLVSAGFTGVGLIMVGVTVVNVAAKQRDAADRDRQMDQLVSIMDELKSVLSEQPENTEPQQGRRRR